MILTRSHISASGHSQGIDYAYDSVGNFLKKTDYSQNSTSAYQYQSGSHRLTSVRLKSGTLKLFTYDNKGNQTGSSAGTASSSISYNVFNKPTNINQHGSQVNLFYDANWARYKQTSTTANVTTTTYYVGNYEIIKKSLGRYFVRYINTTYKRTGTLWEGRYKSSVVDSDNYLLTLYQYIELNPVRAKMVTHPKDYAWSSYHMNGGYKHIELITQHSLYLALGNTVEQRRQRYNELLKQPLAQEQVSWISTHTNKSRVLGGHRFTQQISNQLNRYVGYLQHGGDRRSTEFLSLADLSSSTKNQGL